MSILAVALGLRLWGINFGLPFLYHPDEGYLVMPAANILRTGDFRPIWLPYGSAYVYSLTALYIPYFLYGAWRGAFTAVTDLPVYLNNFHEIDRYPAPGVFLIGRFLTAVLGGLTVLVVYFVGKRLAGRRAGLAAALLLAIEPLHARSSHFATTDVPMVFLVTLALLRILDVFERGRSEDYLWAGIWVGLSASTKFPGGIMLSALLVAHAVRARSGSDFLNGRLLLGLAGMGGGFLVGTPYALDLPYFLNWFGRSLSLYGSGAGGQEVLVEGPSALYYAKTLFLGPSAPLAVLGVPGLLWFVRQKWRRGAVVVAFPITYFAMIALQTARAPRTLLPIIPFLALGAGSLLWAGGDWLASRLPVAHVRVALILTGLVALVSIWPLIATVTTSARLGGPDIRTRVLEWYNSNIPPETKVAADWSGPSFAAGYHNVYRTWNLGEHEADWYVEQQFEYLVISEPRLRDPNRTVDFESSYRELMSRFKLVKVFEGPMTGLKGHIWIYQVIP